MKFDASIRTEDEIEELKSIGSIMKDMWRNSFFHTLKGKSGKDVALFIENFLSQYSISTIKNFIIDGKRYKHSLCISYNDILVHGFPTEEKFDEKKISAVRIDVIGFRNGMYIDSARTFLLNEKDEKYKYLIEVGNKIMQMLQSTIKVGNKVSDITKLVDKISSSSNVYLVPFLGGHSIGCLLHLPPFIPNRMKDMKAIFNLEIKHNSVFAIEPLLSDKKTEIKVEQQWLIKAIPNDVRVVHVENTYLFTNENNMESLT